MYFTSRQVSTCHIYISILVRKTSFNIDLYFQLTCKEALLERADKIIDGMKPMFEALEAVKTDHKKGI